MRRFPPYDPPEYVNWRPDPVLVAEFADTIASDPKRLAIAQAMSVESKLDLYRGMLRTRLHDIALKRWVMQGVISKAWLGTGEEAVTVGAVHALDRDVDVVAPMIRNAGACCEMGMSLASMLRGYLGTYDSPSRGRDGHVGDFSRRVLQPISNIGNMPPVTAGIALGFRLRREPGVALTWIGDGSVKHGGTHEALGLAAARRLPVVFIIQNNQVALGTRVAVHHPPEKFDKLREAYGVSGWSFAGNNVLDAFAATRLAAEQCREGNGPVILSTDTFRMGGHATHDEAEAHVVIPAELFEYWGARDPIGLYEEHLKQDGVSVRALSDVESGVLAEIEEAEREALASREHNVADGATAVEGIYADH